LVIEFVEHIQATSQHKIVYFSIIFHRECKIVVEGYSRIPRKLNPQQNIMISQLLICNTTVLQFRLLCL